MIRSRHKGFAVMAGKTVARIRGCERGSEEILFSFQDGSTCRLYRNPGWDVLRVEEVHGDPADFVGHVIVSAEAAEVPADNCDWVTNTFYKLACANGYLTIRWYGEDSDYYSATAEIAWTEGT